jgi:hypothetical protein
MTWDEMKVKEKTLEAGVVKKCACDFECPLHDTHEQMLEALKLVLRVMYEDPDMNIKVLIGCSTTVKNAIADAEWSL